MISKVIAYIIRKRKSYPLNTGTHELLVFAHQDMPEVPIQVPGGMIDPGESPEDALFREIQEESGLTAVRLIRPLGIRDLQLESRLRRQHYFLLEATTPLPDRWHHQVQGTGLDAGMVFSYFWWAIDQKIEIYSGQTAFLNAIHVPELFPPDQRISGS